MGIVCLLIHYLTVPFLLCIFSYPRCQLWTSGDGSTLWTSRNRISQLCRQDSRNFPSASLAYQPAALIFAILRKRSHHYFECFLTTTPPQRSAGGICQQSNQPCTSSERKNTTRPGRVGTSHELHVSSTKLNLSGLAEH